MLAAPGAKRSAGHHGTAAEQDRVANNVCRTQVPRALVLTDQRDHGRSLMLAISVGQLRVAQRIDFCRSSSTVGPPGSSVGELGGDPQWVRCWIEPSRM